MAAVLAYPPALSDVGTGVIVAILRDVIGQAAAIAQALPCSGSQAISLRQRAAALAEQLGLLAERESDRRADRYNRAWEAEEGIQAAAAQLAAAQVRAQPPPPAAKQVTALLAYYAGRAAVAGAGPCAMHDWQAAPPGVAARRACRRCPAESLREVDA